MALFDQIGADKLRVVLRDFYDRLFADLMIGFLFNGKDKERLIQKEWELTARMLGGPVSYTGRSMPQAHAASPILGGHYLRRLQILKDVMNEHAVPQEIQAPWIAHTESLRRQVTKNRSDECEHDKL